jgi:ribonuclease R
MAKKRGSRRGADKRDKRVRGRYVGHPRAFGFLLLEGGGADLFVPPRHEGDAIDGDTVLAERRGESAAKVTEVVARGRSRLSGTYIGRGAFLPDAHRIPKILSVEGKARKGDKVLVAVRPDALRIRRVLGRAGDPAVEDAAVLAELEISPGFPKPVLAEAEKLEEPSPADFRGRLDLRETKTVVTIDPVSSRDYDDAISLERRGKGWSLGVHIADVSHYVRQGGALDDEARKRGTSVYLPTRVIPMLPEKLSNDLCSLREGIDRLAMSVLLHYDARGKLLDTTFAESVIRSDRRLSYERASRVMDKTVKEKGGVGELLLNMARLAKILKHGRPSLDVPREEIELVFNGQGDVVDIRPTAQDAAHGVIEEFMLAANREVARLLLRQGQATLFRHHPEPADMSGVWDVLKQLGVATGKERSLPLAVARAVADGYGPAVSAAMLRCMPQACYTTRDASHFNLGFEAYTHFTSPIRRYADLVVHRTLRGILGGRKGAIKVEPMGDPAPAPVRDETLEALGQHVTDRTTDADRAESRIRRRRVLEFLLRLGNVPTEGQVTLVVDRGLLVDLPEYGTSGLLPVDILPGGPFQVEDGVLRGKDRSFRLGETLDVCIHRIDPVSSKLDLVLAPRF